MRFNILTVDEFGMTSIELKNMLKNFNVYIKNVNDEIEAETAFKDKKINYNAIIWAMNSVDFSVFDAIKQIKLKEEFKSTPIVIISKFTDKKYIIKAIESGAVEYIAKPYNEETVLNKLCRVLGIPFEKTEDNLLDEDIITLNFKEMFNKELKAASRGMYQLSFILIGFISNNELVVGSEEDFNFITLVNRVIRNNLRETDSSFQYAINKLIVLLPFSNKEGTKILDGKIKNLYENNSMINKKNNGYSIISESITYPEDGKIKHVLLKKLEDKLSISLNELNKFKDK